ncbi:MAG: hypothetical protein HY820_45750 [Acidobacteria bacterium]|nr:hypothetical protein [Acidobacteriota bacterium]
MPAERPFDAFYERGARVASGTPMCARGTQILTCNTKPYERRRRHFRRDSKEAAKESGVPFVERPLV